MYNFIIPKIFSKNKVKRIIKCFLLYEEELREAEYLRKKKIPHIFVNHRVELQDISYVCVDLKKAAYDIENKRGQFEAYVTMTPSL